MRKRGIKLIQIDGVDALFTTTTSMAGAVAPIAEENKIPFIYASTANSIAEGKTYVFKDNPNAFDLCKLLMKEVVKTHEKIALFGIQLEATELCKKGAETTAPVSTYETYAFGETDYKTQLAKIKNSESTALLMIAFSADCNNVYRQIREIGITAQLFVPSTAFACGDPSHLAANPDLLANSYGSELDFDENSQEAQAFKQRIEQRGGTTLIGGSAVQYDITLTLAKAFNGCSDNICVANNIRNTNFVGISGRVSYGGGQIVERGTMLTRFENGNWVRAE